MRPGPGLRGSVIGACIALLVGCADPQLADLDRELARIRSDPGAPPELDIPTLPGMARVEYGLEEQRSPFARRIEEAGRAPDDEALVMPEAGRPREPLEAYDLAELRLVGTLTIGGRPWALVRAPGGEVHRLAVGSYLGRNHGRVVSIAEASLSLVELVVERGTWVERPREMGMD